MARTSHLFSTLRERVRLFFRLEARCLSASESRLLTGVVATTHTTELSVRPDLIRTLVPPHCEPELASRGIHLDNFVPIPLDQLRIQLD